MTRRAKARGLLAAVAMLALVSAGCGDDGDSSDATDTTEAPADDTTSTTEPKEGGLVASLQLRGGEGAESTIVERDDSTDVVPPEEDEEQPEVPDDEDIEDDNFDTYTDYVLVSDTTGSLQMEVPVEWESYDLEGGFIDDAGTVTGLGLGASPDSDGFETTWNVPGAKFSAQPYTDTSYQAYLDVAGFPSSCTDGGTSDYDDGLYSGLVQVWEDCGGVGTTYIVIAASDTDATVDVLVTMQLVTDADIDAATRIVETFQVVGPV